MAWVSSSNDGKVIKAEKITKMDGLLRFVEVEQITGNAIKWHQCEPGDDNFRHLVREARKYCLY